MMAEPLPFGPTGSLAGWELEAWYDDLQDIMCSDAETVGHFQPGGCEEQKGLMQVETSDNTSFQWTFDTLDSLSVEFSQEDVTALEAVVDQLPPDILEFINPGTPNSSVALPEFKETDTLQGGSSEPEQCYSSSPSLTLTEDEESSTSSCGTKRKRRGNTRGGKVRVKERDQENDQKVAYLVTENERLKAEIERLSVEVEKTRKDLIERMVNIRRT